MMSLIAKSELILPAPGLPGGLPAARRGLPATKPGRICLLAQAIAGITS
jgi:hypothetical protein